jgi:hypothetical protein
VTKIISNVDPDLRELTPGYLQNRRKDIKTIGTALKDADLIKIVPSVIPWKVRAGGYGFMPISVIGAAIEKAAKEKAPEDTQTHLDELLSYLDRISVVYDLPV